MMYGWDGWIPMTIVMVVFWGLVIAAIVVGVHSIADWTRHRSSPPLDSNRAQDVLAERFARGEIDEDEFRRRTTALREHG